MELGLEVSQPREDVLAISLDGEVDVYTAPQLRKCFDEQVLDGRTWGHVVLECLNVTVFDSTALGVSIYMLKAVNRHSGNGQLAFVVKSGGKLEKTLRITGLDKVYRVFLSMDSCLAGLAPVTEEAPAE